MNLKNKIIDLWGRWEWHPIFEINFMCAEYSEISMANLVALGFIIAENCVFIQTVMAQLTATDAQQEYIYFVRSATSTSACHIHLHEVSIPFLTAFKGQTEQ